ncbi:PAS domain-containing protein [Actomonas aquatica]|uniref:PAS domain-containing protein n=1 Tax=Actomonas aquatica TaxID=2866162 RepID=A0ABZ1C423_9BACT|nr:PAS domain-containing protein [Opitutus sp. WL0086]WRQ86314.1 PAS domain-containing protein [Opitutus sp. WL0086]
MNNSTTIPTGVPQNFEVHETFFSMTDGRGVITDGNAVFARVSGYPLERMVGENHNLIRHPLMPRAVFHLMWATLRQRHTFMGYVLNLAANANHYWVFAVITPIDDGYLSVRIKPSEGRLEQIEALYADVLAQENAWIAEGVSQGAAAERGVHHLLRQLEQAGWADYRAFSHEALLGEIKHRDSQVSARGLRLFNEVMANSAPPELQHLHAQARHTHARLNGLFGELDRFLNGSLAVVERTQAIAQIGNSFQLSALNAHLAAHPLGASGVVIGTVAGFLGETARQMSRNMDTLSEHIADASGAVSDVASCICVARIQIEMVLSFLGEIGEEAESRQHGSAAEARVRSLQKACGRAAQAAAESVGVMVARLPLLQADREQLQKDIIALQSAQVSGLTEAARLGVAEQLGSMFSEMRQQMEQTKAELEHLGEGIHDLVVMTRSMPEVVKTLLASLADGQLKAEGGKTAPSRVVESVRP